MDVSFAMSVIADHFGVPAEQVTERTAFKRDLGADSLDLIELTMRLEHEFGVQIDDDESEQCEDVSAALHVLKAKLVAGEQAASASTPEIPLPGASLAR